jgi:hypothetical protein
MRTGMLLSWLAELKRGRTLLAAPGMADESKAEQYRRYAHACIEMASEASERRIQAALLHMAQVWLRLADEDVRRIRNEQKNMD